MSSSLDYLDLCRLCLVKDRVSVPIFEDEGDVRQMFLKITACLPVKIAREDKLPKKICDDCVYKVELLYQFWNTTANAEKQLLQWLGEVGGLEDKQGYVTEVLDSSAMKQEQPSDNRLDGSIMQVRGHQNNMEMGMMNNMTLITMPTGSEQFTSVPMDTTGTVQTIPSGSSTQVTHDQIVQNQTAVGHMAEEESEEEDNSDEGCDNEEGLPVKEEAEEDPNDQSLEQTAFVNVPISCGEAGPSGLQQQKISEMSEMAMQPSNDVDPKSGASARKWVRLQTLTQRTPTSESTMEKIHKNPMIKVDLKQLNTNFSKPGSAPIIVTDPVKIKSMLKHLDRIIVVKPNNKAPEPVAIPEIEEEIKIEDIKEEVEDIEESEAEYPDHFESVNENTSIDENASQCDSCDERFPESSSLIIHKTEQSIKRTRAILRKPLVKCNGNVLIPDNNDDSTANSDQYPNREAPPSRRRFLKSKQVDDQPVSCPKCDRIFKRMKYLKVHMVTVHGKQIRCQVCERRFDTMMLLKIHMKDVHTGYFTEFCDICNKGFRLRQALKTHLAAHARDDNLCVCEICGRAFRHEVYLRKHVQCIHVELHGEKKYQCDYCEYATHHKSRFTEHMCKHTGKGLVQCEVCQKYVRKGTLKIHTRIHTGEKPEICEYCGRSFSARKYLTKHLVTHTGEKPYQCQICGKSYTQRGTLTLHFRRHHAEDDSEIRQIPAINDGNTEDCGANEKDEKSNTEDEDLDMGNDEFEDYDEGEENIMGMEVVEEDGVVTYDDVDLFQDGLVRQDGTIEENVIVEGLSD